MLAIDGNNLVLGRLATRVAKKLLEGEEVHIANCENIVILGTPLQIIENYTIRRRLQHKGTPEHSPQWPNVPSLLVRRVIRGMLPWKSTRGKDAFRKLKVYSGNPKSLQLATIEDAKFKSDSRFISIGELCKQIGYSN